MRPDLVQDVRNAVSDDTGIELTDEQLNEILQDPHLGGQLKEWGTDTEVRSLLMNFLSERILGMGNPWPINRDGREAFDRFIARFEAEAPSKGYRFIVGR